MSKLISKLTNAQRHRPKVLAEGVAPSIECDLSGNLKLTLVTDNRTYVLDLSKGDTKQLRSFLNETYIVFNSTK